MAAHVYAWQVIISLEFFFFSNLVLRRHQAELIQPSQGFDSEPDLKMNARKRRDPKVAYRWVFCDDIAASAQYRRKETNYWQKEKIFNCKESPTCIKNLVNFGPVTDEWDFVANVIPAVAFSWLPAYSHGFTERILNKTLSCVRQCAIFENKRENFLGSLSFKSGAYKLPISYNFTTIYKREYLRNETSYRETGKAFSKLQWSPTFFWNLVNFGLQSAEIFLIHSHNCHTSPNASQSSFDTCSDLWEIWICTSKIGGLWGPKLPIFR